MLKLLCSDGLQDIIAFEYRWCRQLDPATMKEGCKILVKQCRVLRGHLALTPECIEFLGGSALISNQGAESLQQHEAPQQQQSRAQQLDDDFDDATMMALMQAEELHQNQGGTSVQPAQRKSKKKYLSSSSD